MRRDDKRSRVHNDGRMAADDARGLSEGQTGDGVDARRNREAVNRARARDGRRVVGNDHIALVLDRRSQIGKGRSRIRNRQSEARRARSTGAVRRHGVQGGGVRRRSRS